MNIWTLSQLHSHILVPIYILQALTMETCLTDRDIKIQELTAGTSLPSGAGLIAFAWKYVCSIENISFICS